MGCHFRHGPRRGDGLGSVTDPAAEQGPGRRTRSRRPNTVPAAEHRTGVAWSAVSGAQDLDDVVGSEAALSQQDKGMKQEVGRLAGQGVARDGSIGA